MNGTSIISHVVKKAKEADIGDVYVATEDKEILDDVNLNGGKAVLTSNIHKTGTDRIHECFEKLDLKNIEYIINLQGDEPEIDVSDLKHLNRLIEINKPEIATLASEIDNQSKLNNENIVKVITDYKITDKNFPIALDFKRKVDNLNINIYHHLGVYAYKPEVLKQLIKYEQSDNEVKNRLEQLRAIENGIKINVALAKFCSKGIDTMEDYLALKKILEYKS
ncbi:MAG: 3-deoxy-manno-octulosonate cytidylyltransferase [Candidatus Pelagibacter sp.]|nr:3-deoxy-manno-octulosonate cytidylyltransferase [Candidatus Pelagibacter sp.]